MLEPTINDALTIVGNSTGTMLANRYRVVRQLGRGGMGNVWLVEDVKLDNKPFAVKMLPAILVSNRRAYEQVKREALIALKLVHPNIVQFRALEEAVEGSNPFLVMDYIDGRTLDDYLAEKGKLTEDETLRVLRPIAAALDYAHTKGVVHRDVKPGNVMIAKDGTPYLLDFGIAREIQETMTRVTGKLSSGTLMYMSPEQLHGAVPKAAQDVYSFAAMAYECLAGAPPFSRGQIEYQIDHDAPVPLTGKAAILAAGVMAGLAKKPKDRPATCTAVLEGNGFSRKERKEAGEVALVATIRGIGTLAASSGEALRGIGTLAASAMAGLAKQPKGRPATCTAVQEGDGFSHKERKERKETAALVATEAGVSRPVATIRGSGALVATPGRAGAPRPPQGNKIARVEHVERVEGKARDGGKGKFSWKRVIIGVVSILGLAVVGIWWWNGRTTREAERRKLEAERKRSEAKRAKSEAERAKSEWEERERKGADTADNGYTKVQLWEGGPYWADTNIGAKKPWEFGYYFWWGDTVGYKRQGDAWLASNGSKPNFSFEDANTPPHGMNIANLRKGWIKLGIVLVPEHDAAHVHWGGRWRLPTLHELNDLKSKCDWTWTAMNGINGYVVRGRGAYMSASIFLPCAGYGNGTSLYFAGSYGYYWSSVPGSESYYTSWYLNFYSSHLDTSRNRRYYGQSVRPVQGITK